MKYDPEKGVFMFDGALVRGVSYPFDWDFIPSTRADDGDPLDAMVLFEAPNWPGLVIPLRPIGIVRVLQSDSGEPEVRNDRVIGVAEHDPRDHFDQLPKRMRDELEEFFVSVTRMTMKRVHILGWKGPKAAQKAIDKAANTYTHGQ
jgi:inorganic pyrophosphatase